MRGHALFRSFGVCVLLMAALVAPAAAQALPEDNSSGWESFFHRADTGTVAVVLIFGTGLVAVLGGIIPGIVRACRGDVHTSEELVERIAHLEHRIASLEQQTVARS